MLFSAWNLSHLGARNRLVRSATYEGLGDDRGYPRPELGALYRTLAEHEVGTIITGFAYVSRRGRAMHPAQCGIDDDDKTAAWERVVSEPRKAGQSTVLLLQIAHAGLQTLSSMTGLEPWAPSVRRSRYFGTTPVEMTEAEVGQAIGEFARAALRAKQAGFDGVQVHAAHGYLVHQFLSPLVNHRRDAWGKDRFLFLAEIIAAIKQACGDTFPVFVKLSAPDGLPGGVDLPQATSYAVRMAESGVEAVEVSYGTMEQALNIFRGGVPLDLVLRHNPLFNRKPRWLLWLWKRFGYPKLQRQLIPFREHYNLEAARRIKQATRLPVMVVGGIRNRNGMEAILSAGDADAVALCRPFVCEPDFGAKLHSGTSAVSQCSNCNRCAVMSDTRTSLRCHQPRYEASRRCP
jgi:2,4-dienoyl-CoA reductase-like NADH-dependent reductase (Old Yellow Enzyme family)